MYRIPVVSDKGPSKWQVPFIFEMVTPLGLWTLLILKKGLLDPNECNVSPESSHKYHVPAVKGHPFDAN